MSRKLQFLSGLALTSLLASSWSCSSSKQKDGTPDSGSTQNAESSPSEAVKGSADPAGTSTAPAAPINVPELIGKMVWSAELFNSAASKIYTGFDGTNPYKVLIDVGVFGDLPETVSLTEAQLDQLYDSPEFGVAAKAEVSKISFEADAAFVTSKLSEEYTGGRVYELTTVKAGSSPAKAKYGTVEIPVTLQITAYTPAQVAAGKLRYNNAVAGATPSASCAGCHRSATGIDHSPYYMSKFSDAAILSTIEVGLNTDDNYQTKTPHKMTFTNATDKAGIVPYLRSLDPNLLPDQQAK